jgi:hypothetical protein
MDRTTAMRRDQVMRGFFEGKDWDRNDEFLLKRHLVVHSSQLLPGFPFLVDDEWDVGPGKTNKGRGDLVFADGEGAFAVVEVKFIDLARSGKTARAKRNDSRGKVVDQAVDYGKKLYERYGPTSTVEAYSFTNEVEAPVLEGRVSAKGAFVTR